jgi:DNA helicase-2/ATP-dependent DNA helicase PcrA
MIYVGDKYQQIYEWRGAIPLRMLAVADNCEVFTLENNYRSTPTIVVASNQLVEHNENRILKTMRAFRQEPGKFSVNAGVNSRVAAYIADRISNHGQIPTAVLSRTHVLLAKISKEMHEANIPHHYCGADGKLMESEPFRRLHAVCKLLLNPHDDFSFSLAREVFGIENSEYLRLLTQSDLSPYLAWLSTIKPWPGDAASMPPDVRKRAMWRAALQIGHKWQPKVWASSLLDLVEMQGSMDLDSTERALRFLLNYHGATLQGYLDWIATYDIQEEVKTEPEAGIQLMTVHAAKGLEWENVVLVGWNEGILPNRQALDSGLESRLEEERRIAYVAMTRAKDTLIITSRPTVTESKGRTYLNPPSRFLDEIRLAETPNAVA